MDRTCKVTKVEWLASMFEDCLYAIEKSVSRRFTAERRAQPVIQVDGSRDAPADPVRYAEETGEFTGRTAVIIQI